jgi:hypothetical protein
MLTDESHRHAALCERYSRSKADQARPNYDYLSAQVTRASYSLS